MMQFSVEEVEHLVEKGDNAGHPYFSPLYLTLYQTT